MILDNQETKAKALCGTTLIVVACKQQPLSASVFQTNAVHGNVCNSSEPTGEITPIGRPLEDDFHVVLKHRLAPK